MALVGVQLYSLRDELKTDYSGVIEKISAMGYDAVETAGYPGTTAAEATMLYRANNLTAFSQHSPLPIGDMKNQVIEEAQMLGATYLITGGPHGGWDSYSSLDTLKFNADAYMEAADNAAAHGLKIGHHNHDIEMQALDGKLGIEWLLELTHDMIVWEMDTYWVKVGGQDPVELLNKFGGKIPLLHLKDGPGVKDEPMVAVGQGSMEFEPIFEAAKDAELFCVELDNCATDMLVAVEKSIEFVNKNTCA